MDDLKSLGFKNKPVHLFNMLSDSLKMKSNAFFLFGHDLRIGLSANTVNPAFFNGFQFHAQQGNMVARNLV